MMKRLGFTLLLASLFAFVCPSDGQAEVIFSFDTDGSTSIDVGAPKTNQIFDVYISQTVGDTDEVLGIIADFQLSGGSYSSGQVSSVGTGTAGFFGAGNLLTSQIVNGGATLFTLNQEFDNPQSISSVTPELLYRIEVDTSALASGTYELAFDDTTSVLFDPALNPIAVGSTPLQFTITAIPEPSCGLAFLAMGFVLRRQRRCIHRAC
ncbi:hypothetical protein [Rhodopirellula sp. MGV]|uniref:hypothetical protein n=1 Tax=Rhodopirellula sp. MGV TaxID=2023130 RepID=UPI000B971E38|nr:hypothetical protein [Rhodopirellula sp. MGV]OYP37682.1 hypothetical protein CGZ80_04130 [Rhodopirellula sp. MGV]PNY37120.1 hypothetical protein C2E31_08985 [Rhodopirellula baltica]